MLIFKIALELFDAYRRNWYPDHAARLAEH